MTNSEKAVLDALIRYGDSDTVLRETLVAVTLLSDRQVRHIIQKLRHKDVWIISNPKIPGYRLAKSPKEWDRWVDHWNDSNRFNMLKKSKQNKLQLQLMEEQAFALQGERWF